MVAESPTLKIKLVLYIDTDAVLGVGRLRDAVGDMLTVARLIDGLERAPFVKDKVVDMLTRESRAIDDDGRDAATFVREELANPLMRVPGMIEVDVIDTATLVTDEAVDMLTKVPGAIEVDGRDTDAPGTLMTVEPRATDTTVEPIAGPAKLVAGRDKELNGLNDTSGRDVLVDRAWELLIELDGGVLEGVEVGEGLTVDTAGTADDEEIATELEAGTVLLWRALEERRLALVEAARVGARLAVYGPTYLITATMVAPPTPEKAVGPLLREHKPEPVPFMPPEYVKP